MKYFVEFALAPALAFCIASAVCGQTPPPEKRIQVTSSAFQAGGNIPDQFTCKGANVNPALQFRGAPAEAKSLLVIVDDPDAPAGLFTHWVVWNIPPETTQIGEKSVPEGAAQGLNDFGNLGYRGPCPPSGTHRYTFHVLALDTLIDLRNGARRAELDRLIGGHILARGQLTGRYTAR